MSGVAKSSKSKTDTSHAVRAGRDATSAVRLSQRLTAAIDAWAEAHQTVRSEAIRQLVELGLKVAPVAGYGPHRNSREIEAFAVKQITELLDPSLPPEERERRIRRLIDGPPEFCRERVDLPKHGT
ncbi:hypothetical protein [Bradyrhizobium sp. STM 3562]|uniref:hypothetical protein n=1 Tax=Bradyrhizobium sp. STM 3562 TaxID=578924 RepID=UPI00388EB620